MLTNLYIKDFILIDQITLEFHDGFSVFTGETGAGKSIFIDAVSTLAGQRMSSDMIRTGADKAIVEGQFEVNKVLAERLNQGGYDSTELVVTRSIDRSGKSVTRINQRLATVAFLKQCFDDLIDIHCQNDNQYLLNEKYHRQLLDEFAGLQPGLNLLKEQYLKYKELTGQKEKLLATTYNPAQLQMMEYQLKELTDAAVKTNEDKELSEKLDELSNYEKTQESINEFTQLMNDEVLDKMYQATRLLEKLGKNEKTKDAFEDFVNSYYSLKDDTENITSYYTDFNFDQKTVDDLNSRLFLIQNLKRKYATDIEGLLSLIDDLSRQLEQYGSRQTVLEQLDKEIQTAYKSFEDQALQIRSQRQQASLVLQQQIEEQIRPLNLPNAVFKVEMTEGAPAASGLDNIRFLISMNSGQGLQPLNKVASGGELSRLMLGLKTIFNRLNGTRLVVFDEIDTGVSGYVAFNIGLKMYQISRYCQVFTVTHLASVAACGQHHYRITKTQHDTYTTTKVDELDDGQRLEELAILSSSDNSQTALKAAGELRQRALAKESEL